METSTYNAGGLLTSRTWSDATPTVTYTYDAAARLLTMVNPSSTISWTYDALDRRVSETQHLAGVAARTVGYAYDDDGNLAALGRPDGTEVAYAYDLRDQLTAVTADGPPPLAQYSYDEMGRRTNLLLENGQNTASTFDTAGRLLAHTHTIGGNPLDAVGYTLNANGWRTAIARPGGKNDTYTYDTTGQVLTATAASTAGPTSESFAYDLASNRTSSTASPPDGVQGDTPMNYAANALDQYTSLNGQAQTHDANGNTLLLRQPTQDDVTFVWDSENRMLAQERGGSDPARIVNHYDALHRRVKKDIYEKPGGTFVLVKTHTFIYDGWNVIEERQFNSGGTLAALTRLTWGADLSGTMQGAGGVGGLLMAEEVVVVAGVVDPGQSPIAHYYWHDGNGNVTGITDDSGAIEGTFRYTSFGALAETATTTAFATAQPWKFSTKYHDTEVEPVAGTYYYGYRSYLPSVGRWPSRDPIGELGGVNLYGMAGNDAVNKWDYLGAVSSPGLPPIDYGLGEGIVEPFHDSESAYDRARRLQNEREASAFRFGGSAGKNVTSDVRATLRNIKDTFTKWDYKTKCESCKSLHNPSTAMQAWDIEELATNQIRGGSGWGQLELGAKIEGRMTATYGGLAYAQYTLNWLMWGHINRLCSDEFPDDNRYDLGLVLHTAQVYKLVQVSVSLFSDIYEGTPVDTRGTTAMVLAGYNRSVPTMGEVRYLTANYNPSGIGIMKWKWTPGKP